MVPIPKERIDIRCLRCQFPQVLHLKEDGGSFSGTDGSFSETDGISPNAKRDPLDLLR